MLDSIRLREGAVSELTVQIQSTDAQEVLLAIIDRLERSVDSTLVDFAAGEPVWTRGGAVAVAMVGDTVLLVDPSWYFPEDGGTAVTDVGRADGKTLWGPSERGSLHILVHTTELVIASNDEGTGFLDPATGGWTKISALDRGIYGRCATDDTTLLVCMQANRDLVAIPLDGAFTAAVELPDNLGFAPTAIISSWVFLNEAGDGELAFAAMDAAGTPSMSLVSSTPRTRALPPFTPVGPGGSRSTPSACTSSTPDGGEGGVRVRTAANSHHPAALANGLQGRNTAAGIGRRQRS